MESGDWKAIAAVLGTVLAATVSGFWAWMKTKASVGWRDGNSAQAAINLGFQTLVTELQQERRELMVVVSAQSRQIGEQSKKISEQSQVIHKLRNEVFALTMEIRAFKAGRTP